MGKDQDRGEDREEARVIAARFYETEMRRIEAAIARIKGARPGIPVSLGSYVRSCVLRELECVESKEASREASKEGKGARK